MTTFHHDAIVIGTNFSGLVAAAHLAKKGLRILILEPPPDASTGQSGFVFSRRLPFLTACASGQILHALFSDLAIPLLVRKEIRTNSIPYQVILPRHRIDLHAERSELFAELGHAFPGAEKPIREFYRAIDALHEPLGRFMAGAAQFPPASWSDSYRLRKNIASRYSKIGAIRKKRISDLLKDGRLPAEFALFIQAQLIAFSWLAEPDPWLIEGAYLLNLSRGGTHYCPGGNDAIYHILRDRVAKLHGIFRPVTGIRQVLVEGGRAVGVRLADSRDTYRARCILLNAPLHEMVKVLPAKALQSNYGKTVKASAPTQRILAFHFGAEVDALPVGLVENAILVPDPERPLAGDNLLLLSGTASWDRSAAPPGFAALSVFVSHPLQGSKLTERVREQLRDRVLAHLHKLMPFSQDRIQPIAMTPDRLASEASWHDDGFRYNLASFRCIERGGLTYRTPLKSLFLTGREILPGLGLTGEAVAGRFCAAQVLEEF